MGNWSFIQPEATTNYITNPSFEIDTTEWTNSSLTTFARSTTRAFKGIASLHCISDNTGDYVGSNVVSDADATETWTATCRVWVVSGDFKLTIVENAGGWTAKGSATTSTTGKWVEVTVTVTLSASVTDAAVWLGPSITAASEFYVDAIQFEQKGYATTYCDGTQEGCTWNGAPHASTSTRSAQSRAGGRVIDIDATYGTMTNQINGFGLLAPQQGFSEQALMPGALLQSSKDPMRTLILTIAAKGTSLANLHSVRKDLIEAFKPDLVKREGRKPQPVRLRYDGAGTTVEIAGHYAGGLEGTITVGTFERIVVRFICEDPYFYEIGESAAALTEQLSVADADYAIKKVNGTWSAVAGGALNGEIYCAAIHPDGSIYIGGAFTNVGDANGDYILKYNPTTDTFSSLGTGADQNVYALEIGPDGCVYAGGVFTSMGGVANTANIAKWTPSTSTWSALATGLSAQVNALKFGRDGLLYIGGNFANAGGDANADCICKWNGTAFSSVGSTAANGICYKIALAPNGDLYFGGAFTNFGDANGDRIAKWNGTAWSSLGTGLNATVLAIEFTPDGIVYVGGTFTDAGSDTNADYIARWNGVAWSALGSSPPNGTVYWITYYNGLLYVSGGFTVIGGESVADRAAIWNGSSWAHMDFDLPGTPTPDPLLLTDSIIFVGTDTSGTATTSKLNTITNNGTQSAYPKLMIKRSGGTTARLEWLKNETTGKICWFNYSLLDGETLTVDFAAKVITSDYFDNVMGRALLPNSDFGSFCLQNGSNDVSLYVYEAGSPTVTASMVWTNTHHSVDGVAA